MMIADILFAFLVHDTSARLRNGARYTLLRHPSGRTGMPVWTWAREFQGLVHCWDRTKPGAERSNAFCTRLATIVLLTQQLPVLFQWNSASGSWHRTGVPADVAAWPAWSCPCGDSIREFLRAPPRVPDAGDSWPPLIRLDYIYLGPL